MQTTYSNALAIFAAMSRALAILSALTLAAEADTAAASELKNGLTKLFDLAAKNTPPAVARARAQYETLKRIAPGDGRIDYAYALVLVNQHRYDDALPLVTRYIESENPELSAHCVKIWAHVQHRAYDEALAAADTLSRQFPADSKTAPDESLSAAARFLGTIFGYLELVRPGVVDPTEYKKDALARLGAQYEPAFAEGREEVAKQLRTLKDEQEAEEIRLRGKYKGTLNSANGQLAVQETTMESLEQRLAAAKIELSEINLQLIPLQSDFATLSRQTASIGQQIAQLERNRGNSQQNIIINDLKKQQSGLKTQEDKLRNQISNLQGRAAGLIASHEANTRVLGKRAKLAKREAKRAEGAEDKLSRASLQPTHGSGPLAAKIMNLSTYAPFPFNREKDRVLSWFAE